MKISGKGPDNEIGGGEKVRIVVSGRVIEGNKLGRVLGFPTANIAVPQHFTASNGVYAAWVEIGGEQSDESIGKRYGAMANLGVKPTFSSASGGAVTPANRVLELHLLDFQGDLYGRELTVELIKFVRPEQKFDNPDALKNQIKQDEKTIKNILQNEPEL
jgi:riboflavin kinase/FMN adenylyltransferase